MRFLPLLIFIVITGLLAVALMPHKTSSLHEGKTAPDFSLTWLDQKAKLGPADLFRDDIVVINFFASWCVPCRAEQPVLKALADHEKIKIYGVAYKDQAEKLRDFLATNPDPYKYVLTDLEGRMAIDWGVTGVPETFIIDRHRVIRYHLSGPLTHDIARQEILPLLARIRAEP